MTNNISVIIAAAGKGSRAGLPFPKTLYPIQGKPILHRIFDLLSDFDNQPTVVVSPEGMPLIQQSLQSCGYRANLVCQSVPSGMGDAVLCFKNSPVFDSSDNILLIWGDIPFIQRETVEALIEQHFSRGNDFTFATKIVNFAYTVVTRDASGNVLRLEETRESGELKGGVGERDIGLFVFKKDPVMRVLTLPSLKKYGATTGEHGFLYVIEELVRDGFRVEAVPVATDLDLVSLNSLDDIRDFI